VLVDRSIVWQGEDSWRAEAADVSLAGDGLSARGTQIGAVPVPYRLDYELEAAGRFVTRSLRVEASGQGWSRRLHLAHDGGGGWHAESEQHGEAPFGPPGGSVEALAPALDCDLGLSPLTNLMPIRRHGLEREPGSADLLAAWVSVPDLALHAYPQRYEHVRSEPDHSVVRFIDRGLDPGFESELVLDRGGLVLVYPGLARSAGFA
jgi:uncharacterized protein